MASNTTTTSNDDNTSERKPRDPRRVGSGEVCAKRVGSLSSQSTESGTPHPLENTTASRIKMATKLLVDLKSGLLEDLNYNNLGTSCGETLSPPDSDNQAGKLSATSLRSNDFNRSRGFGNGSSANLSNDGRASRSSGYNDARSGSSSTVPTGRNGHMFMEDYPLWDFIPKDMQHPVPLITRSARLRAEKVRIYMDVFYSNIEKHIVNDTMNVESSRSSIDLTHSQGKGKGKGTGTGNKSSSADRDTERVFHAGVEGVYNPLQVIRNRKLRKKYHDETKMERVPFFKPPIIAVLEFSSIPNRKKYKWYVSLAEKYIDLSWRVAHWDELVDPQGHLWSQHRNYYQYGNSSRPQSPGDVQSQKKHHISPSRLHYHHHHHHHHHRNDVDRDHDNDNDNDQQPHHHHHHHHIHNLPFGEKKTTNQNSEDGTEDNAKTTATIGDTDKSRDNFHLEVPNRYSPNVEKYISPATSEDERKPRVKTLDRILNRAKRGISRSSGSTSSSIAESEGIPTTTRTTGNGTSLESSEGERKGRRRSVVGTLRNAAPNLLSSRAIRNLMVSRNSYLGASSLEGRRMSVYEPFDGPMNSIEISTEGGGGYDDDDEEDDDDDLDMEEEDETEDPEESPMENPESSQYPQRIQLRRKMSRVRSRIEKSISEELDIPIMPARKNEKTKGFVIGVGKSSGSRKGGNGGADEEGDDEEEEEEDIREGYKSDVDNYYNTDDDDEGDNGKNTNGLDATLLGRLNVNNNGKFNKVPVDSQLQQYWQDVRNVKNTIALLKHRRRTDEIVERRALTARNTLELDHDAEANIAKTREVIETYNGELDRVLKIGNNWANKLLNDYTIRVEGLISSSDRILSDINTTLTLKLKLFQENTDRYDSIRTMQSQKMAKILYRALEFLIVLILWTVWLVVSIFKEIKNGITIVIKLIKWMVW